ncbi:nucleopolyhedrovirus P10 family protein [Actinacidiphila oryziradicis]|uniref:Nucleopolyhedrovirus P10 family protein n=1 Tax=Actinacidiphila oryziradicis TaxID=2571141 RepID=A0A4U0SJL5_9ACTN|nr:nucleopolyhedrovirus P10 family protein [Actinacidiphila oryziradicis]TKA09812.1 nucleopolyhedrovirus P10 family protein [Actinacidiphila oryziradicis]
MSVDRLADAVREQLAPGPVLPLGEADDGTWITEHAAVVVLRRAAHGRAVGGGVRLAALRIGLAAGSGPGVPADAPPGSLPRRPLRIEAAFEASPERPLPDTADRLRHALWDSAREGIGLAVTVVDLTVTGLLDDGDTAGPGPAAAPAIESPSPGRPSAPGTVAVPGVARLTSRLGGFGSGVQIAVAAGYRPLDVARAVRATVGAPVVVTDIG